MRQETRAAFTSVLVFGMQAIISILLTRFLIRNLGVEQYSVVPLINSFLPYLALAAGSLGTAAGRELTIARRSAGAVDAERVHSTGVLLGLALAALVMLVAVVGGPFIVGLLNVDEALYSGAVLLLAATGLSAAASIVRSPFLAVPFSENRLDLENLVVFTEVVIRAALIFALFVLVSPAVTSLAVGTAAGAVVALTAAVLVARRLAPELRVLPKRFDHVQARSFFSVGGWFIVGQLGALLFWSTDLIILSWTTSAAVVGLYGTAALWPVFLRGLASASTNFLNPVLVGRFGEGDREGVLRASRTAVRVLGVGVAVPVGIVAGFAYPILDVWIGPEVLAAAPVLTALVLPLGVNLAVVPLFGVHVSYGKLAVPGIATLLAGVVNIFLSFAWAETWPVGLGVALATAVALTAKNALFTPWYAARIQSARISTYYSALMPGALLSVIVYVGSSLAAILPGSTTFVGLAAYIAMVGFLSVLLAWCCLLQRDERDVLTSAFKRRGGAST